MGLAPRRSDFTRSGGVLSGSLALIADAIHNLSDALSLVLAFVARMIAQRPADNTMTFGFGRAEIVAALINYTTLILLGIYLTYEAIMRPDWLAVRLNRLNASAILLDAATVPFESFGDLTALLTAAGCPIVILRGEELQETKP